jgi:hypothetical protein
MIPHIAFSGVAFLVSVLSALNPPKLPPCVTIDQLAPCAMSQPMGIILIPYAKPPSGSATAGTTAR